MSIREIEMWCFWLAADALKRKGGVLQAAADLRQAINRLVEMRDSLGPYCGKLDPIQFKIQQTIDAAAQYEQALVALHETATETKQAVQAMETPSSKPTSIEKRNFECMECGKKFKKPPKDGCPKCGGNDIDVYVPKGKTR